MLGLQLMAQVKTYPYPEGKEGLVPMHDFAVSSLSQEIKTYQCEVNPHKKVQNVEEKKYNRLLFVLCPRTSSIRWSMTQPLSSLCQA